MDMDGYGCGKVGWLELSEEISWSAGFYVLFLGVQLECWRLCENVQFLLSKHYLGDLRA